jgi:hypothetical protein
LRIYSAYLRADSRIKTTMAALPLLVFGSIALAVILWAAAEILCSRALWTAAAALTLLHSAAAFQTFYGGSHAVARQETARQTAAVTGIEFTGGIYINYLLLAVWAGDAAWWWMSPAGYGRRPRWLSAAIRGFIFFIILNGALIFADGWARIVVATAISSVVIAWFLKRW